MKSILLKIPSSLDEGWVQESFYEFLLSTSITKMTEYKKQMEIFERKYKTEFEEFQKRIRMSEKEDFEEWDDYIIWEGLHKGYMKWKEVYEDLSSV